ncbi:MAG TPA: hypothetical protein VHH88_10865 [Verrucomicrobiae bacterium]|nr:hypothetical protein [Verrucomicrobiae bacterium]
MLTQLSTVKARLAIDPLDVTNDAVITNAIKAISQVFEKECNRAFARQAGAAQEFDADDTEILLDTFPLETITRFEKKSSEAEGWIEQTNVDYLVRHACMISLESPLGSSRELGRVVYTGGYVLPGDTVGTGQTALPDDLEQAAVEQAAAWFQNRDKLGLVRYWPKGGIYLQFLPGDLLPTVRSTLDHYKRIAF